MALDPNALIDIAYIETHAKDVAASDEARYEGLINQASTLCESKTGRVLAAQDVTVVLDGPGGDTLMLPEYPINSITSVHLDSTRTWGAEAEITDHYVDPVLGVLYRDTGWGKVRQSIRVVFNGGYATVPEDLKEACLEIVLWLSPRQKSAGVGLRGAKVDGQDIEYEITMPLNAQQILSTYRRTV